MNPLLQFTEVVEEAFIYKDEFTVTLKRFEQGRPLKVWFKSRAQMELAYGEWMCAQSRPSLNPSA